MRRSSTWRRLAEGGSTAVGDGSHPRVGNHETLERSERVDAVLHHGGEVAANRQPRGRTGFGPEPGDLCWTFTMRTCLSASSLSNPTRKSVAKRTMSSALRSSRPSRLAALVLAVLPLLPEGENGGLATMAGGDDRVVSGQDRAELGVVHRRGAGLSARAPGARCWPAAPPCGWPRCPAACRGGTG